jgi:ATP-binding protein involved in chromosome partitioning
VRGLNEEAVRQALRGVIDPELGASVVDLNMVRQIDIADGDVTVHLVLTVPGCPLVWWIMENVRQAIGSLPGVTKVEVNLLDEPWQPTDNRAW